MTVLEWDRYVKFSIKYRLYKNLMEIRMVYSVYLKRGRIKLTFMSWVFLLVVY